VALPRSVRTRDPRPARDLQALRSHLPHPARRRHYRGSKLPLWGQ